MDCFFRGNLQLLVQPQALFGKTDHCETIVLLKRQPFCYLSTKMNPTFTEHLAAEYGKITNGQKGSSYG
jgi:hypothetical protein